MKKTLVFTGSYSRMLLLGTGDIVPGKGKGITVFEFDPENGTLKKCSEYPEEPNPTYLCIDRTGKYLYADHELKQFQGMNCGGASAYAIDAESGALRRLNSRIAGGTDSANIAVDPSNAYVLVANYASGSVCVLPREEDGSLGKPTCFLQHVGKGPDESRQECPHAHQIMFDRQGKRVFVPDLGTDQVVVYDFDYEKGYLIPAKVDYPKVTPGHGPRHCVFNEAGDRLYLINEMGNSIFVFSYDQETGATKELQNVSTIPEDYDVFTHTAAIRLHPNGKFLYGSNRGHDTIATYRVDGETGLLTLIGYQPCGGENPRDFDIDPTGTWLISGGMDTSNITVFRIDGETGLLTKVSEVTDVDAVTSILIAEVEYN